MKTIRLTHQGKHIDLTANEAVSLQATLTKAMAAAGIEATHHATVARPSGAQSFASQSDSQPPSLTDC